MLQVSAQHCTHQGLGGAEISCSLSPSVLAKCSFLWKVENPQEVCSSPVNPKAGLPRDRQEPVVEEAGKGIWEVPGGHNHTPLPAVEKAAADSSAYLWWSLRKLPAEGLLSCLCPAFSLLAQLHFNSDLKILDPANFLQAPRVKQNVSGGGVILSSMLFGKPEGDERDHRIGPKRILQGFIFSGWPRGSRTRRGKLGGVRDKEPLPTLNWIHITLMT